MTPALLPAGVALAAAVAFASPSWRPAADPAPAAIDAIFAAYDHTNTPGCALGVYRDGRMAYARGYGMADLNQGVPITPATAFYIASTSKQFTAMSIALLAEAGTIGLDDPVRKWIPELPAYADGMTIRHLVHHTSGLRDYLGLWALSGRAVADEIPAEAALDLIARQRALDFAPGSRYSYSNSGYFLLSEIVRRASGRSLRDYAASAIFSPLGMTSTQFHDDATRIVARRAEGYQPAGAGRFAIVRTSFALVGDGGLLTTVEDLLRWDANFYANRLGRGDAALIAQVTTPGAAPLADGSPQRYAFGLMPGRWRGLPIVEHGGAFIGFRAQLLRFPDQRFSVAVLCNDYTAMPEQLARRVAELYLADRMAPEAPTAGAAAGVPVAGTVLDGWAGRYEALPGFVAEVTRTGDGLAVHLMGSSTPLVATSESTFVAAGALGTLTFARGARGVSMLSRDLGMWEPAPRLADAPALTEASARVFTGRYASDELDSWAEVAWRDGVLQARMRWMPWAPLRPMAPDTFVAQGARVAFTRDRRGAVTGFSMSQVRTRNVGFVKRG